MGAIFARIRSRKQKEKNRKICITEERLYKPLGELVHESHPYDNTTVLDEENWFFIENFAKKEYAKDTLDILKKSAISPVDYNALKLEELKHVSYIFSSSDDEKELYFQRVGKASLVQKKRIVLFNDYFEYQPDSITIVINEVPDAIYIKDQDTLFFQKLSSITGIFKNINELCREATNEETEAFLKSEFLKSSIDVKAVSIPNRKRIALAIETLKSLEPEQKRKILDNMSEYWDKKTKDGIYEITNNKDLENLLYGIEQRFYTTKVGDERRIANSIIKLSQNTGTSS